MCTIRYVQTKRQQPENRNTGFINKWAKCRAEVSGGVSNMLTCYNKNQPVWLDRGCLNIKDCKYQRIICEVSPPEDTLGVFCSRTDLCTCTLCLQACPWWSKWQEFWRRWRRTSTWLLWWGWHSPWRLQLWMQISFQSQFKVSCYRCESWKENWTFSSPPFGKEIKSRWKQKLLSWCWKTRIQQSVQVWLQAVTTSDVNWSY